MTLTVLSENCVISVHMISIIMLLVPSLFITFNKTRLNLAYEIFDLEYVLRGHTDCGIQSSYFKPKIHVVVRF